MAKTKSLAKLRLQNQRLRDKIKAESELINLERERIDLAKKNKRILIELRRSPSEKATRSALRSIGRGFFKGGKTLGKGLMRYARFIDKAERRNERASINLRKVSRRK